jgi:hypothetical protein
MVYVDFKTILLYQDIQSDNITRNMKIIKNLTQLLEIVDFV